VTGDQAELALQGLDLRLQGLLELAPPHLDLLEG
jgi:hypothetical protein